MGAFFSGLNEPHCSQCRYPLGGLGRMGSCPECGDGFNLGSPVAAPTTLGAYARYAPLWLVSRFAMTWKAAATLALIVGHTAIVVWLAVWAYREIAGW